MTLKRGKRPPVKRPRRAATPRLVRSRRLAMPMLALGSAAAALFAAWLYQLPDKLWMAAANGVASAGFEVKNVEVSGLKHMRRLPVYTAALDGASDSMLLVDLDDVRERLLMLPWVEDASVGRQLPDTLAINISERVPFAIWQNHGRHALVDMSGAVLPASELSRFATLPIVVGKGANTEAAKLMRLLHDYPAVSKHFAAGVWVGERRWDLKFRSGETLALPGDYAEARAALDNFVRIDRDSGLVDKGFSRFDMRLADRLTVRLTRGDKTSTQPKPGTEI